MKSLDLLESTRKRLQITWDYEDDMLLEIISEGMSYLVSKIGEISFADNTTISNLARALLFDYCRYARGGAVSSFENDNLERILNLQLQVATYRTSENEN